MNRQFDPHNRDDTSSERLILAILIALLVHLFSILFIMLIKHHDQTGTIVAPPKAQVTQEFDLPSQQAGGGTFGKGEPHAKLIYYDAPVSAAEPPAPPAAPQEDTMPEKPPMSTPSKIEKPLQPEENMPPLFAPISAQFLEDGAPIPAPQKEKEKRDKKPENQEQAETPKKGMPHNPFAPRFRQPGRTNKPNTLQKITEGFLESMASREGNNAMNVQGTREARMEDIATLDYIQKLSWQLQQAFKTDTNVVSIGRHEHANSIATIVIDAHGEIVDLELKDPPNNPSFDRLLRTIIYHATPFPPIPKHLNRQIFVHRISVRIDLPAGTHRPHWICY